MKKQFTILVSMLVFSKIVFAVPQTDLSRKVLKIPDNAAKATVIAALGPPTHAFVGNDLKQQSVNDPNVSYILLWENPPCSVVEVWFGRNGRMNGVDGGQFCGNSLAMLGPNAAKPKKKYACTTSGRKAICQ